MENFFQKVFPLSPNPYSPFKNFSVCIIIYRKCIARISDLTK